MKTLRMALLCALLLVLGAAVAASAEEGATAPGERGLIVVGYCQDGDYYEFDYQIFQIGAGLVEEEAITCAPLGALSQGAMARTVWNALTKAQSSRFAFAEDGYFDIAAGDFAALSDAEKGALLAQRMEAAGIDLMLTMGTMAGQMVRDCSDIPYMNFIASDPVQSGITGDVEFSGSDRAWAHVNIGVEEKALDVMGDIFAPKSLGIVYNADDPEAYIYSGAASVDAFAEANGLEVIKAFVSDSFENTEAAYRAYRENLLNAHEALAESGIDLYILTTSYLTPEDFYPTLLPFMEKGIPVFSLNSTEDVRFGALAAVEMFDYKNIGRFGADCMLQYQDGESLSRLPQVFETAPFLVLNIDTLRRTGMTLNLDALISASKIYPKYEGEQR